MRTLRRVLRLGNGTTSYFSDSHRRARAFQISGTEINTEAGGIVETPDQRLQKPEVRIITGTDNQFPCVTQRNRRESEFLLKRQSEPRSVKRGTSRLAHRSTRTRTALSLAPNNQSGREYRTARGGISRPMVISCSGTDSQVG